MHLSLMLHFSSQWPVVFLVWLTHLMSFSFFGLIMQRCYYHSQYRDDFTRAASWGLYESLCMCVWGFALSSVNDSHQLCEDAVSQNNLILVCDAKSTNCFCW